MTKKPGVLDQVLMSTAAGFAFGTAVAAMELAWRGIEATKPRQPQVSTPPVSEGKVIDFETYRARRQR